MNPDQIFALVIPILILKDEYKFSFFNCRVLDLNANFFETLFIGPKDL